MDTVIIQTSSTKLRQKALQDNPSWDQLVETAMVQEQAQKKAQEMPDSEENQIKALQEQVKRLQDEEVRKLQTGKSGKGKRPDTPASGEGKASCQDCGWYRCTD